MKPERKGRLSDAVERARLESERAREYAEDARERSAAVALAFDVYERDRRHLGGLLSGALAYRFFLWALPFTLLLVGLLGAFTAADDGTPAELSDDFGLQGTLADLVSDAAEQKGWWIALLLGLFGTAYAGLGAVRALRVAHSAAWAVPPTRMAEPRDGVAVALRGRGGGPRRLGASRPSCASGRAWSARWPRSSGWRSCTS